MATSQKLTVERMEELYDAFNRGEIGPVVAAMADDITWFEPEGEPHAGTYHGSEEILENVLGMIPQQAEAFTADPIRFIADGELFVVGGTYAVTSKSGEDYEIPFAHVWRQEAGRLSEFRDYSDTHVHREAFGV